MESFAPRRIEFHELRNYGYWRLKLYSVVYGHGPVDLERFEPGFARAEASLPLPAVTRERPGVGFLIAHQGKTADYLILGWWDHENELPLRVSVNRHGREARWRAAEGSESICVWDLEILWAERQAYIDTVLSADGSDVAGYLARTYSNNR